MDIDLSELPDYPPRIVMDINSVTSTASYCPPPPPPPPPSLQVVGLDRECSYTLPTPSKITYTHILIQPPFGLEKVHGFVSEVIMRV